MLTDVRCAYTALYVVAFTCQIYSTIVGLSTWLAWPQSGLAVKPVVALP